MSASRLLKITGGVVAGGMVLAVIVAAGCVERSGGTWMIRSAPTPEGWPELTPVGEVQVRAYPAYREAVVTDVDIEGEGMNPMFMTLFRHIKDRDIAMTTPVDMGYTGSGAEAPRLASMAFLYRSRELGDTGEAGAVHVRDLEPQTFASVGVRGDYTVENFSKGLTTLDEWLEAGTSEWMANGSPRYLGYNGPFVPWFMKYGEVQVPVRPLE